MKTEKIKSIRKIGIEDTFDLIVEKNHNFIANNFLVHNSGTGKGLVGQTIARALHKTREKYLVIVIADPKVGEWEWAFQMFEPTFQYHKDGLSKIGRPAEMQKVKIYHPFTFNLNCNDKLPPINFFTLPIKELTNKDWGVITEADKENESIKILKQACQNIGKEDGIWALLHMVESMTEGKKEGKIAKRDMRNFGLRAKSGTSKSVTEISNYLQPFKRDYFLAKENCPLNMNWKDLLQDQEHYHIFSNGFIKDEKLRDFTVSALLNGIIANKKYLKNPVVIVIPEIAYLVPFKPKGHKEFLGISIKDALKTIRSSGRGMSAILDTQVFSGVDEGIRESVNEVLLGELNADDIDKLSKIYSWKRDIKDQLKKMERNSFFLVGEEDAGPFNIFMPTSANKEPKQNFFEEYKKHFSDKMKTYNDVIEIMEKINHEEIEKVRDKIKREEKAEKERREQEKKEKEESQKQTKDISKVKNKFDELKEKSKDEKMIEIYNFKIKNPEMSWREIAKNCRTNHNTAKKYFLEYSDKLNLPKINGAIENP